MRLAHPAPPRPQIPVVPLGSLALLVFACVTISGMQAASRGPAIRFASVDRDGSFDGTASVRVEVLSEDGLLIDGTPVPLAGLAEALGPRLAGLQDAAVVLVVSPEATYETMVAVYGAITALPRPPRIAFPARLRDPRG